jgi:hypothetical protein
MFQFSSSLPDLLKPFVSCFNEPVFATFGSLVPAWIVCLGRRTISRVWQTTGRALDEDHSKAYRFFNQALWNFDDLARVLLLQLLTCLIPGCAVWVVVDDTLCHKRGAKVAFGGIFLDAVLSSRKHKIFRFGVNWVTLGVVVQLPFRQDRFFCINLLWRVYSKKEKGLTHQTKSQLARQMIDLIAEWLPQKTVYVVADCAYVGKHLLNGLPRHVHAIGPIHRRATLSQPLPDDYEGKRKIGDSLARPIEMWDDEAFGSWDDLPLPLPNGTEKKLQVKVIKGFCWYPAAGQRKMQLVLIRDPDKKWRDEMLLSTDPRQSAQGVILGYMRRWSVEVCYWESKELLGLHEPQVWTEKAVQRAHPMAWFVGGLVLLWYAQHGKDEEQACWQRPWYQPEAEPTFAQMLATMRLHLWRSAWEEADAEDRKALLDWMLHYMSTAMG